MARATMYFPSDFQWGTVSAAYQRETGIENSEWRGRPAPDVELSANPIGKAENWSEPLEEAVKWGKKLGNNAIRLSLEWALVEPEPGRFDLDVLNRYRAILRGAIELGLEPMVTLHHFSTPHWLMEEGDFGNESSVDFFGRYARQAAEALGDLVTTWVTFNEPLIYLVNRTLRESFPRPQEGGWKAFKRAYLNMLGCHAVAYRGIKSITPSALVGVAKHYRHFEAGPYRRWLDGRQARYLDRILNRSWMDSLTTGQLMKPFGHGTIDELAGAFDFVGISYFGGSAARFSLWGRPIARGFSPIWPDGDNPKLVDVDAIGLFKAVKTSSRHEKPIYITANGISDASDTVRPTYLLSQLRELWRGISFCFPVVGYFHHSLIDGYEWDRGWKAHYGLVGVEPSTGKRDLRASGHLYKEISQSYAIDSDMVDRYAPDLAGSMFPGRSPQAID